MENHEVVKGNEDDLYILPQVELAEKSQGQNSVYNMVPLI